MVKTASFYDNFCKTGNYVIYDVIIWTQDGNCKKMARENFSIGAFYNITKNQDNPIKTVGRDSFWAPKHLKIHVFRGRTAPIILGDTTGPRHITCVLEIGSKTAEKTLHKQTDKPTDRHYGREPKSNNVHTDSVEAQPAVPPIPLPGAGHFVPALDPLSLSTFQNPAGSSTTAQNYIHHTITL